MRVIINIIRARTSKQICERSVIDGENAQAPGEGVPRPGEKHPSRADLRMWDGIAARVARRILGNPRGGKRARKRSRSLYRKSQSGFYHMRRPSKALLPKSGPAP